MNEPAPDSSAEIISRYFDVEPAPENDAALTALLTADPDATAAFVSTARLHAMIQRQLPRRRSPVIWKWFAGAAAAALTTAAALTLLPHSPKPQDGEAVAGENWQPVATAKLPRDGLSPYAQRQWGIYSRTEAESFVPLPADLKIEQWENIPVGGLLDEFHIKVAATWPEGWLESKQIQAVRCRLAQDGTVCVGTHPVGLLPWLRLRAPAFDASGALATPPRAPVYFDHLGQKKSVTLDSEEPLARSEWQWPHQSNLDLALRLHDSKARVLNFRVFNAANHAFLSLGRHLETKAGTGSGPVSVLSIETLLSSAAPLEVSVEFTTPREGDDVTVAPAAGSTGKNAGFETKVLGSLEGTLSTGLCIPRTGARAGNVSVQLSPEFSDGMQKPDKENSCTFVLALPAGAEVEVSTRTSGGVIPSSVAVPVIPGSFVRVWCFPVPLSSVQALILRPLNRHRIIFTVPLPVDPWNGLNDGVTDALELRIPFVDPLSAEAHSTVDTFLGIDSERTNRSEPPLFSWKTDWKKRPPEKNLSLRQILLRMGTQLGRTVEIETTGRLLRDRAN